MQPPHPTPLSALLPARFLSLDCLFLTPTLSFQPLSTFCASVYEDEDSFPSTAVTAAASTSSRTNYLLPCICFPDCSNEQNIKYGGDFRIMLTGVNSPITLEYRPIAVEANQTFRYAPLDGDNSSEGAPEPLYSAV